LASIRNFFQQIRTLSLDALTAIRDLTTTGRDLTAAVNRYNERVSELHDDIKRIEASVGYLHRVERLNREGRGQKVNV
jgi:anti-sigma-K factor RskA